MCVCVRVLVGVWFGAYHEDIESVCHLADTHSVCVCVERERERERESRLADIHRVCGET